MAPKAEYVEWFAGYSELANVLRCACSPAATVLHAGCGISSLSQALYDDGFLHQISVDFSGQCMLRQRALCLGRPEIGNAVMDCTRLGLRSASVDVCMDKGTLDALLCMDEGSDEAVAAMAAEVLRVLRPDGLWVRIGRAQAHLRCTRYLDAPAMMHLPRCTCLPTGFPAYLPTPLTRCSSPSTHHRPSCLWSRRRRAADGTQRSSRATPCTRATACSTCTLVS